MSGMIARIDFTSQRHPEPAATGRSPLSRQEAIHDAELVRRFNSGDEGAFAEIVARHTARVISVGFATLGNHADAEEIAQDTFMRAHRALHAFRGDAALATWLHRIALNLSRNRYWYFFRRRRHATFSLDRPLGDDSAATLSDLVATPCADPARTAMVDEFSSHIAACMNRLGEPHRGILVMRNSLNRSYEEISRDLGISAGTVKSRIARARGMLRRLLSEASPELGPDSLPDSWFETPRSAGRVEIACA